MAIRIQLPPAKRPHVRLDPIIKPEMPAELARLAPVAMPVTVSPVTRPPMLPDQAGLAFASIAMAARAMPVAAPAVAEVAPMVTSDAAPVETPASEALLQHSSAPAMIRASSLVFRWGAKAAVLLAVGFLTVKFLVPFLHEMRNPGRTDAIHDKEAPTAVRLIQQTRQVVAKSDANVAYLNEVAAAVEDPKAAVRKVAPAPVAAVAPVVVSRPVAAARPTLDHSLFQEAVAKLTVGGVFDGAEPRAYLDGRLVKYGEIINRNLGLRFVGVDSSQHAVLFTNAENVTFRKHF